MQTGGPGAEEPRGTAGDCMRRRISCLWLSGPGISSFVLGKADCLSGPPRSNDRCRNRDWPKQRRPQGSRSLGLFLCLGETSGKRALRLPEPRKTPGSDPRGQIAPPLFLEISPEPSLPTSRDAPAKDRQRSGILPALPRPPQQFPLMIFSRFMIQIIFLFLPVSYHSSNFHFRRAACAFQQKRSSRFFRLPVFFPLLSWAVEPTHRKGFTRP